MTYIIDTRKNILSVTNYIDKGFSIKSAWSLKYPELNLLDDDKDYCYADFDDIINYCKLISQEKQRKKSYQKASLQDDSSC